MAIERHLADHQVVLILQELVGVKRLQGTVDAERLLAHILVNEYTRHSHVLLSHQTVEVKNLIIERHISNNRLFLQPSLVESIVLCILGKRMLSEKLTAGGHLRIAMMLDLN